MRHYRNQPSGTVSRARQLRRAATDAERTLWAALRERLPGTKWRRQMPVGPYFADFACFTCRLVVELDGSQHAETTEYDAARTRFMEAQGYRVLRFWNSDVTSNLDGALQTIAAALHPLSHRERGGAAQRRRSEGDLLDTLSPSPSQPAAGPLPLPMGEGCKE